MLSNSLKQNASKWKMSQILTFLILQITFRMIQANPYIYSTLVSA